MFLPGFGSIKGNTHIYTFEQNIHIYLFKDFNVAFGVLIHNNLIDLKITCVYDFENSEGAEFLKKITLKSRKLSVENVTPESKKILL